MKKKSLKKKMVIALAGIILAGSMGWSQIPARAAVNGDTICAHEEKEYKGSENVYDARGLSGHSTTYKYYWYCPDCKSTLTYSFDGPFEAHDFSQHHDMIEDLHNGLYMHWIMCKDCLYQDEVLSDDPNDPKM